MNVLELKGVTMRFGGVTAVDNLNLRVEKDEIVAVIGPNGAGKTTAFNIITGVYAPSEGAVHFSGKSGTMDNITGMRPDLITKRGIARTFQNIRLFGEMTVLENVLIANHLNVKSGICQAVIGWPNYYKEEKAIRYKSMELLDRVELLDVADCPATGLPYGQQRKLEIVRALATGPSMLLLDEPAAGMNPQETLELTEFVRQIRRDFKVSVLMIEHHIQIVMDISDRIYVLDFGKLIAEGGAEEIQKNPDVIEAYLGVVEDAKN